MSALERLARVQRDVRVAVAVGALLWGASVAAAVLVVVAVADRALTIPLALRVALPFTAALAGVVTGAWRWLRAGRLRARYGAVDHPAAREIMRWLAGEDLMTDEEVQTQ